VDPGKRLGLWHSSGNGPTDHETRTTRAHTDHESTQIIYIGGFSKGRIGQTPFVIQRRMDDRSEMVIPRPAIVVSSAIGLKPVHASM
jgi:hypothetical protein